MAYLNKVMIIGYLGQDPHLTTMNNGEGACSLSVATSKKWQDQRSGEMVERKEWHRVVLYRKLAEIAGQYLRKGAQVYIEGELQTRKWTDRDGIDRWTTEIIGNSLQMLGKKEETNTNRSAAPSPQPPQATASPHNTEKSDAPIMSADEQRDFDDDIPF